MKRSIYFLICFSCLFASPTMAQLVKCNFEKCEAYCDRFFGTGCHRSCEYICDDGKKRTSDYDYMNYSCEGITKLFNNKPNCAQEIKKDAAKKAESRKRAAQWDREMAERQKQKDYECDEEQSRSIKYCLAKVGRHYIDKVNDYLVNGSDRPSLENIRYTEKLDTLGNKCSDDFSYKNLSNGFGMEMTLVGDHSSCYDAKSTCSKGMKIILKAKLKKGMQDVVADECDFWNDCEKMPGLVLDNISWEVRDNSECGKKLKNEIQNESFDMRRRAK